MPLRSEGFLSAASDKHSSCLNVHRPRVSALSRWRGMHARCRAESEHVINADVHVIDAIVHVIRAHVCEFGLHKR
eukprot:1714731-Rhodomonas_salina.1